MSYIWCHGITPRGRLWLNVLPRGKEEFHVAGSVKSAIPRGRMSTRHVVVATASDRHDVSLPPSTITITITLLSTAIPALHPVYLLSSYHHGIIITPIPTVQPSSRHARSTGRSRITHGIPRLGTSTTCCQSHRRDADIS